MSIIARYSIFIRLSSEENTVFDFVTFRNWWLNPLIVLVVLSRKRHSTSNIIEGLNPQYRKVTKTKSVFPSDSALEKMLYLASGNVIRKWTQRYRGWNPVLNQLIVLYGERLTSYL